MEPEHTRAEVSLDRLCENYNIVKRLAPRSEPVCVVKADAYGHGAVRCTEELYGAGARRFAVAHIGEAVELRESLGGDFDILILGHTPPEEADTLRRLNITQNVYSAEYAALLREKLSPGGRLKIHLKIDTGMNRLGFPASERGVEEAFAVYASPEFETEGCFTHFACADEPEKPMTREQINRFLAFTGELAARGAEIPLRHMSASSGIINFPEASLELVRPGIILYGLQPSDTMAPIEALGFRQAMRLVTRVTNLHTVKAGQTVSYGATFTAERDLVAATLPIGYGDGFIRGYRGMSVTVGGVKCPIIGRICMDQCMADVSGAKVGLLDEVEVWGDGNPVKDFAAAAGTITYECTCILGKRVPRIYIK